MSVFQVQQQEHLSIMINLLHTKIYFLNKTYSPKFLEKFLQSISCKQWTSMFWSVTVQWKFSISNAELLFLLVSVGLQMEIKISKNRLKRVLLTIRREYGAFIDLKQTRLRLRGNIMREIRLWNISYQFIYPFWPWIMTRWSSWVILVSVLPMLILYPGR